MLIQILRRTAASGVLALFAAAALPSAAEAQRAEWRGSAILHSFTPACSANGWSGAPQYNARFMPSGLGDNDTSSRLSFFSNYYAFGFELQGARFTRSWATVRGAAIWASWWFWDNPPAIRVTTQTPSNANLRATSPVVRLVGQIRNFEEIRGCTVTFDATMLRRR